VNLVRRYLGWKADLRVRCALRYGLCGILGHKWSVVSRGEVSEWSCARCGECDEFPSHATVSRYYIKGKGVGDKHE
jgi:hypothetical protein